MAQSFAFKVEGVEPTDYRARPDLHGEFWRTVVALVLEVKDRELAAGLDAFGQPMTPISKYTREHRKSAMGPADPNAPPLTPAYGLSRTRSLLDGRAHAAQHYALFFWRSYEGQHWGRILGYHRKGGKRLPVRNVIGLSPAGKAEVERRARQWWDTRVRHVVPVPEPVKVPTPGGATLIRTIPAYKPQNPAAAVPKANRRIGQVEANAHVYTLQGGSVAQINRAVANGTFSGFERLARDEHGNLTAAGARVRKLLDAARGRGGNNPPAPPAPPAPAPAPAPKPKPKPRPAAPVAQRATQGPKGETIPPKGPAPAPSPPPAKALGSVPSHAIANQLAGPAREQAERALAAIDRVHGFGDMPPSRVPLDEHCPPHANGVLRTSPRGKPEGLALAREAYDRELTLAHEFGHFVEHGAIPATDGKAGDDRDWGADRLLGPFWAAAQASRGLAYLRDLPDSPRAAALDPVVRALLGVDATAYHLRPEEVWARAYAQWVALRSGDAAMLEQVRGRRAGLLKTQWDDDDFGPIARAIDRLFEALGWRAR